MQPIKTLRMPIALLAIMAALLFVAAPAADVYAAEGAAGRLVYQFDLSVLDDVSLLSGDLAAIPLPGKGDATEAVEQALARLGALEDKWAGRKSVISEVVKGSE